MYGWNGRILQVDLTSRTIKTEPLTDDYRMGYTGGAGVNARLLYDLLRNDPHRDPLDPACPLIIGCGPLVGTRFPCASRCTITAKSPLTGIFGDSNAGGWFPARLKQAGYDHVVIRGAADRPVVLVIEQDVPARIIDAEHLWGKDTYATDALLHKEFGDCETLRIGPAGEHLVRYASVLSGTRRVSSNGRTGMGCVMGSKKLKAIVVKGSRPVPMAGGYDAERLARSYRKLWLNGPGTTLKRQYGTLTLLYQIGESVRIKNEQEPMLPEHFQHYDLDRFVADYKTGQTGCFGCPVACTQKWKIPDGPYKGEHGDKVEYGHLGHLGPLLGIFDFGQMLHLADLSNRLGMDCIQFGFNAAAAIECSQRGMLDSRTTGGLDFAWGNAQLIETLLLKTSRREGFGDTLAEGPDGLAARIGRDAAQYAANTKGMSFTYSCTYGLPMSLASSVATRGADHLKGHPFAAIIGHREMLEKIFGDNIPEAMLDHTSPVAKGRVVWWQENYKMIMDSIGLCFLPVVNATVWSDPLILTAEMGEMYRAVTGCDPAGLFTAAERAYQIERCFNTLLGCSRDDDIRRGSLRGASDPVLLPGMLDEYYHYRGCSPDGLPTRARLQAIGLADVADDLAHAGKLSDHRCPNIAELLRYSRDRL